MLQISIILNLKYHSWIFERKHTLTANFGLDSADVYAGWQVSYVDTRNMTLIPSVERNKVYISGLIAEMVFLFIASPKPRIH